MSAHRDPSNKTTTSQATERKSSSAKSSELTPDQIAERMVSRILSSVGPTTKEEYRAIGLGTCGTVFEIPDSEYAFKKGRDSHAMSTDFILTNAVYNAATDCRSLLQAEFPDLVIPRTPACRAYYPESDDAFWANHLNHFPKSHREKGPIFKVDRILPVPLHVRSRLIEAFFDDDEHIRQTAMTDPDNKDCLVRVYLGERESSQQQDAGYDSLRNFPLRLNMMEKIGLDIDTITQELALALAILHWKAKVDGMDTEFVIGSAAKTDPQQPEEVTDVPIPITRTIERGTFRRRSTHLWMLDFDKAHRINLDKHDVEKYLVPAFRGNDPYFPQPQTDDRLWNLFCQIYLQASEAILSGQTFPGPEIAHIKALPQMFLDGVKASAERTADWDENRSIVFE